MVLIWLKKSTLSFLWTHECGTFTPIQFTQRFLELTGILISCYSGYYFLLDFFSYEDFKVCLAVNFEDHLIDLISYVLSHVKDQTSLQINTASLLIAMHRRAPA